jgi:hypothetical protein
MTTSRFVYQGTGEKMRAKKGQGIFTEARLNPVLEALVEGTGERKPSHRNHVIEPFMATTI